MSRLKADPGQILDSHTYTAPDYKNDDIEWVRYAYPGELVDLLPGIEVTDNSYSWIDEGGQVKSIFYLGGLPRFYNLNGAWYELRYDTVRKTVWDAEHA